MPRPQRRITIQLPLPPVELQPNSRSHWALKNRIFQAYKQEAIVAAHPHKFDARTLKLPPLRTPVELRLLFLYKVDRRHDEDNLLGSVKAALDGFVSAGLLFDDDSKHLRVKGIEWQKAANGSKPAVLFNLVEAL